MAKRKSTKPGSKVKTDISEARGDLSGGESEMDRDLKIASVEITHVVTTEFSQEALLAAARSKPNRIVICKNSGCHDVATSHEFCRLHYLANWKKLKQKEAKTQGLGLDLYLKELSARFPEEFFEKLRADVEEMAAEGATEAEEPADGMGRTFDVESDEDMDDIMKGIRIEDY